MNQAQEFYVKNIHGIDHILGGSLSLKKQIPSFREPTDIDVMITGYQLDALKYYMQGLEASEYGEGIYSCKFNDGSKIDLITVVYGIEKIDTVTIGGLKYLSIKEIVKYKIKLIEKSIESNHFNEHNKHLQDLIFINNHSK